jgi:glycosyltransferase involved in cell wall biosynthesis
LDDNPGKFAESVLKLLSADEKRRQLAYCGRQYIEQHHHWATAARHLEKVYAGVVGGDVG